MHFDTTPALVAAAQTDELLRSSGALAGTALTVLAIAIGASIIGYWIASFAVTKERATIGRAIVTFLAELVVGLVFGFGAGIAYGLLSGLAATEGVILIVMITLGIIFLIVVVAIPMQIYDINAVHSLGFLILSGLIGFVITQVGNYLLVGSTYRPITISKQFEEAVRAIAQRQNAGDQTSAEFTERQAALKRRYEQLEIRRKYLPPNDHRAYTDYERDRAAYERDLEEFRAEYSR